MSKSTVKPNRINVRRLDASLSTSSRSFQVSRVHSLSLSLSLVRIEMANLCRGERLESFSLRLVKLANEDSTRFKSSPSRVEATFERRCSSVRLLHHDSSKEGNATFRPIPIREGFLRNRLFSFRLENYSTEEVRESLARSRYRGHGR